ncbi:MULTISPECIES: universal stress protein [unclassified Mesorhizobium]|uniref:universal stress protein n=1 Tax=unclassified Mesorhizobium TaxID=325217 RepID=UPI00333D3E5F
MNKIALLPLVTYPEANSTKIALNAIAVVKHIGAALHALTINVDIPGISNPVSRYLINLPEMIRETEATSRKHGLDLLEALKAEAARVGSSLTTEEIAVQPASVSDVAAVKSRYFDFALIGLEPNNQTARMTVDAVLFGSGRPTIILPESANVGAIDHVIIAWDGSRVAARAVADAYEFLQCAAKITVLTVTIEKPLRDIGESLALSLRMRGLPAEGVSIDTEDRPIGVTLQERAVGMGADLLVMGAYGHSRMRDFVVGGATKGVLGDLRLPVLLSH